MEFTATEIAQLVDGKVLGDASQKVSKLSKIEEGEPKSISFLANDKYKQHIYNTKASVVIVNNDFKPEKDITTTLIFVKDAYSAFTTLLQHYNKIQQTVVGEEEYSKIDPSSQLGTNVYVGSFAYVGKNCTIGNNVKIYPHCYIGDNVQIADDTIVYSGVKIYPNCIIGKACIIHSNSTIGADGFGFAPSSNGMYQKIPQIGNVIIQDFVEIGASCTIDRATMGSTIIEKGAKLDNQIQIAHNVQIGENTVIASQAGIAGSVKIGKNGMIGGQVGIAGHLQIADNVQIQAQSGVNKNTQVGEQLYGSPAMQASKFRKSYVVFKQLPNLLKRIDQLEQLLKQTKK